MARDESFALKIASVGLIIACLYLLHHNRTLKEELALVRHDHGATQSAGISSMPSVASSVLKKTADFSKPTVFIVTPTYTRKTQLCDLTRLSHTLFTASQKVNLHWIVVEDSQEKTGLVFRALERSYVSHTHLNIKEQRIEGRFKANTQRNEGIKWIQALNPRPNMQSVVYFGDDDNAYDERIFEEMLRIRKVGVWPVAYSGARRVEYPVVQDGKVVDFSSWVTQSRKDFPLDMASFAVNIGYFFRDRPVMFVPLAPSSTGEAYFLRETGIKREELEPLANMCTEVMVWHVKTYARSEDKYDGLAVRFQDV